MGGSIEAVGAGCRFGAKKGCNGLRAASGELPLSTMARTATGGIEYGRTVVAQVNSYTLFKGTRGMIVKRRNRDEVKHTLTRRKTKDDYQTPIMLISGGGSKC